MNTYDGSNLARAWLSVAVASGKDDTQPALCRTVAIDLHAEGMRLTATDSYVLLTSWVPNITADADAPEPGPDEAPVATAVAMDPHGRAKGFFGHLLKVAGEAEKTMDPPPEVRVQLGVVDADPETNTGAFEGMEATYVIVEHPDHERLKLQAYDGSFPAWQKLLDGFKAVATRSLTLNPDLITRLAKAAKVHGKSLTWRFGGLDKMAAVEVAESFPYVHGAVMPILARETPDGSTPEPGPKAE